MKRPPAESPAAGIDSMLRSFLLAFGSPGRAQRELILASDWLEDLSARGWLGDANPETLRENLPGDDESWEPFFLSTFDVGCPAPPVPLFETHYRKDGNPAEWLHENILYYKRFGAELEKGGAEGADHLRRQLGFLQYLCWLENAACGPRETVEGARLARADFIRRHLLTWLPMAAKAARKKAHPLWAALLCALSAFVEEVAHRGLAKPA